MRAISTRSADLAPSPSFAKRFDLDITVGPAMELGEIQGGRRRIIPITGGRASGDVSGEVLAGGADWQTVYLDGLTLLEARYAVRLNDGTTIGVINRGVRRAPVEVARRLAAGERVEPHLYYFRTAPVFEVAPGPHHWLAENVFIGAGERLPDRVRLQVWQMN